MKVAVGLLAALTLLAAEAEPKKVPADLATELMMAVADANAAELEVANATKRAVKAVEDVAAAGRQAQRLLAVLDAARAKARAACGSEPTVIGGKVVCQAKQ